VQERWFKHQYNFTPLIPTAQARLEESKMKMKKYKLVINIPQQLLKKMKDLRNLGICQRGETAMVWLVPLIDNICCCISNMPLHSIINQASTYASIDPGNWIRIQSQSSKLLQSPYPIIICKGPFLRIITTTATSRDALQLLICKRISKHRQNSSSSIRTDELLIIRYRERTSRSKGSSPKRSEIWKFGTL
jgi:hypothetical protein